MSPRHLLERYRRFRARVVVQVRRRHEYAVNRYYAHLVDPFFTEAARRLGLSPHAVTTAALAAGLGSAAALLAGHGLAAGLLLQLHHWLDGADGNLARLTGRCTRAGALYDAVSDQIVRAAVFPAAAWVAPVGAGWKLGFLVAIYLDLLVVHAYVLPCMRRVSLVRQGWKQWCLDRGIIPGLDHFTIFLVLSVAAATGTLGIAVPALCAGKLLDTGYRVWECLRSERRARRAPDAPAAEAAA